MYKTDEMMKAIENIFREIKLLKEDLKKKRKTKFLYCFKNRKHIVNFIVNDLKLSSTDAKYWYIGKALLLAFNDWKKKQIYSPSITISRLPYFRTVLYHCWYIKGINPNKCISTKIND